MKALRWLALPVAALGALASCSHKQEAPKQPPVAATVPTDPSKQTLQQTSQELATQQAALDAAHKNVMTLEQQLTQARAQEDQERAKVLAIQQRAARNLDDAQARALQEQAASVQAQGLQTIAGEVREASSSRMVLHTQDGRTMTFIVSSRTRVLIGTEQHSIKDIQQGADAQVAYDPKAEKPTAVTVHLLPATR
jgi:hypothetical protein